MANVSYSITSVLAGNSSYTYWGDSSTLSTAPMLSTAAPATPAMSPPFRLHTWEKVAFTTGLTLLIALTLLGNILVVVSFYTYRPLRTVTNYFIVSLSLSDIMVAVISMPVWITFVLLDMNFSLHGGKVSY